MKKLFFLLSVLLAWSAIGQQGVSTRATNGAMLATSPNRIGFSHTNGSISGVFDNAVSPTLTATGGGVVGGNLAGSANSSATASSAVAQAYLQAATNSSVQSSFGSFAGTSGDTSSNVNVTATSGSVAVGFTTELVGGAISGTGGSFIGANINSGHNLRVSADGSLVSIRTPFGSNVTVSATRSAIVGRPANDSTNTFESTIAVMGADGTIQGFSTNGYWGNGAGLTNLNEAGLPESVNGLFANRNYKSAAIVTTTISNAVAAIADASFTNRYLLYVPNGSYNETVDMTSKPWIDIVGQSRSGVIVGSASTNADTFKIGGLDVLLANMTIYHTNNLGDLAVWYPIHADASTPASCPAGNMLLLNLKCQTFGTQGKSGLGAGLRSGQRLVAADCSFISSWTHGVNIHNTVAPEPLSVRADFINCIGQGATGAGLYWANYGSGKPDLLCVSGGTYSGSTVGIIVTNDVTGTNETTLYYSPTVTGSIAVASGGRSVAGVNPPGEPSSKWTGSFQTGQYGWSISDSVPSISPLAYSAKIYLNTNQTTYMYNLVSGSEDYWRLVVGDTQMLQVRDNLSLQVSGSLINDGAYTRAIGSSATPWLSIYTGLVSATNVVSSTTITATNGVVGASGSIMLTTNVSVAMAANTYTNVGNYDYTTVFGNVTASTDALTNGTAGRYFIAIHAAFAGAGAASLYEGAVFTNTVECTIIEWQRDVTTTFGSASASGIVTLPANCRIEYKIKNPDAETATFAKLGLTVMGAN